MTTPHMIAAYERNNRSHPHPLQFCIRLFMRPAVCVGYDELSWRQPCYIYTNFILSTKRRSRRINGYSVYVCVTVNMNWTNGGERWWMIDQSKHACSCTATAKWVVYWWAPFGWPCTMRHIHVHVSMHKPPQMFVVALTCATICF